MAERCGSPGSNGGVALPVAAMANVKFSRVGLSVGTMSSVTVLFPAVGARSPTCARKRFAGSSDTGGWGPVVEHLRRDRRLFLLSLSLGMH